MEPLVDSVLSKSGRLTFYKLNVGSSNLMMNSGKTESGASFVEVKQPCTRASLREFGLVDELLGSLNLIM